MMRSYYLHLPIFVPTGKYLAFISENAPNVRGELRNAPAETKILFFAVNYGMTLG